MKVVFITHYTDLYGANKSLLNLMSGLASYNVDIHLIAPANGKITEIARSRNIQCTIIPSYNEIHHSPEVRPGIVRSVIETGKGLIKYLSNRRTVQKYADVFKDCDIIHVNSSVTFIGSYFARKTGKPLVWHIREFGWADYRIRYNFGYGYFQHWLNRATAVISISNAIYTERVATARTPIKELIYNGIISREALQQNKQYLQQHGHAKNTSGTFTFAIVGNLNSEKNQLEALQAFYLLQQKLSNVKLLIVGTGMETYLKQLTDYTAAHHMEDKVEFTGFIDNIESVYKQINCLLMCSKNEALGRVTIEAMSYGIPVIGYKAAGTMEIIADGHNGLLYTTAHEELYEKMRMLIADEQLYNFFVKNAIDTVEHYTIEQCASSVYNLYRKCLGQ